jgi:PPOX class probable F420-dependent enzyme
MSERGGDGEPRRDRPWAPGYGISASDEGLLHWSWAQARLVEQRTYLVVSTSPDGAPHAAPVWAIWNAGTLFFSTGAESRKYRNLQADGRCVVALERDDESLVLRGRATTVGHSDDPDWDELVAEPYRAKYGTDITGMHEPLIRVSPEVLIAQIDREGEFAETATRWTWRAPPAAGPHPPGAA